ncbi:DUF4178 domain-containing protein [Fictibacillus gelatini]|uniref:DUF4178 domain-containing protein n=1 Tax=Fictibacillus gelatini TaxID=225985 RepID=UPI00041216C2|nr:DUF4178 domain-containing protein [Fictibacillus gelatini]
MGLFNRIKNLVSKPEPPKPERTVLDLREGDMVEVSFVTYEVIGSVKNHARKEQMVTLRDGNELRYLHMEDRETLSFALYSTIDGRLDSIREVPSTIELDGVDYYLEEEYNGRVIATGKTPFSMAGEQFVWRFQSDQRKLLRIEWQDGRFMMYEGEPTIRADVQVVRAT